MVNKLLDAVPCTWSACYTTPNALIVKVGVNADSQLLTFDGTYWKAGTLYLKNHTLTGNSYTISSKEALNPPSGAVGFATAPNVWYGQDRNSATIFDMANSNYCGSLGWSIAPPSSTSASIPNGVPPNPLGTTWSAGAPGDGNWYYAWNNSGMGSYHWGNNFYMRCVK